MLQHCKDAHHVLNWEKCHFMVKEGVVFGHKVSKAGLEVDKAKINVISKLPAPTNIKDRKGTENVAADHLSRIENEETSDDSEVDDNFPRETLMEINTEDEPWFADFANYLVSDIIPKGMTYQQKNKFFSDIKHYFWKEPYLFKKSPEFHRAANNGGKKETKAMFFHKMDTEEISDRFVAPCFISGFEAYDGEVNLGVEENMISNEFTVKLCLDHEVKRRSKVVKKELIMDLRGEIYFMKFIINLEEDNVEPGVVFGRSFLCLTKAIADFGTGTVTVYPELDPSLVSCKEEEKIGDDWDLLLDDLDFGDISHIEGVNVLQFVSLIEKDDPGAFMILIRLEGKINLNALADTGSDINTMPYRIYKELGREDVHNKSPEFHRAANNGGKKETKAMFFHKMDTEEISDRFVAPCFISGFEAYDGEVNLGVEENMISNEFTVKLCLDHEVKRRSKVVKKELIMDLRGEIYFMKFIINLEEDNVEPGVVFGRSFLCLTKAIADFGTGTVTVYPELDPSLVSCKEEEKIGDDWDLLLDDLDFGDISHIEGVNVLQFVSKTELDTTESDSDDEEEYVIQRNKFGASIHGPKPASPESTSVLGENRCTLPCFQETMETHDDEAGSSRPKRSRQYETVKERTTGYDKIQKHDLWLLSMFDARHQNGYANVAWLIARWMKRKGAGTQKERGAYNPPGYAQPQYDQYYQHYPPQPPQQQQQQQQDDE
nr:retrovirus-related Pol polyprotein [Tanacetum cinerariifolium]